MTPKRPRLVVFDLDFTLWPFWVDGSGFTQVQAPFYKQHDKVYDSWGKWINISSEILQVLKSLKSEDIMIGIASSTKQIQGAEQLIQLFDWNQYIDYKQIYPGSKLKHFRRLKELSYCDFSEMLFFDDDIRYINEVGQLGVFGVHVEDTIDTSTVQKALAAFAQK